MPDAKPLSRAALQRAIVDRIVADLSPAMRAALLWLPEDGSRRVEEPSMRGLWGVSTRTRCRNVYVRLTAHTLPTFDQGREVPRSWWLTDLGKLVRAKVAADAAP